MVPSKPNTLYFNALCRLFRPLARFCIRRSIKLQDALEALKLGFLEAAQIEMEEKGEKETASRLSIMTGVHRKDVMRLFARREVRTDGISLPTRIIGQWRAHPKFKVGGKPRALTVEGAESEFAELVRSVSKEMNPYTVLFELERVNAVVRKGDKVNLVTDTFVPKGNEKQALEMLASDSEDLIEAVQENIFESPDVPNLHVTTLYDNIAEDSIPEIREWLLKEGEALHAKTREYLSKHDRDTNPMLKGRTGGVTVSLGTVSRVIGPKKPDFMR